MLGACSIHIQGFSDTMGSWNSLIIGYIECGEFKQALALYECMRSASVHPCAYTLVALLKACAKLKDVKRGCEIHFEVADLGLLKRDAFVGTALVDMYAKCGSLEKAWDVFEHLSYHSVVLWNALIAGYAKRGEGKEALKCFDHMKLEGVCPDVITFTCSLKACGIISAARKGSEIHAEVVALGLLKKDVVLGSSTVDMYAKCGLLVKAHEVLNELSVRAVGSWNALIGGYAKQECGHKALKCFEQMQLEGVSPNVITFICILKVCGSLGDTDKGMEINAEIERKGMVGKDLVVGSALVDMYCKCGLLTKGQEVFDRLPKRNVDSWNALITGYVQHDFHENALICLQQMSFEGVVPDCITFVCCLKACGNIGDVNKGMDLHFEVARVSCFEEDLFVGNALVDMYAKCGLLAKSQEVFDSLSDKDIVSWNALLAGYVKLELFKEALNCFRQLQLQAVTPDAVTLACCLKACGGFGAAEKGIEIHGEIERNGLLEKDLVVGNNLVDMYAKCGLVVKAQEVFDNLPKQDVDSWNALIMGYLNYDCGDEALDCYEQMQLQSVLPDAVTYTHSLKACGSIGALDKGREIHAKIERQGLAGRELVVGVALVDMYAKFGLLVAAQEAFDKISNRDVALWNTLIAGYARQECGAEALYYIEQMRLQGFSPNAITFVCSLKACGVLKDIEMGKEIHLKVERKGFLERELVVGNAVVDMYSKCGFLAKAHEAFNNLPYRDIVSWNILITGYINQELSEEALACFDSMEMEGVSPDAITFACSLKACGCINAVDRAREIHEEIERRGLLERDLVIVVALIDAYAKCGSLTKAQEVFDKLPEHDSTAWNVLIAGYAKHERSEEVLQLFDQMHLKGEFRDAITFACSLKACGSIGATDKGREIHAEIEKTDLLEKDLLVGNGLVDMYSKGGFKLKAREVFGKLPNRDIVSWNALISGYAQLGESDDVFYTFDRMREETSPDWITFVSVLNACNHAGLVGKAEFCFIVMINNFGIIPTVEHYTCMVDLLGRAGQLNRAAEVMMKFPIHPSVVMWCTVLGACRKWGNLELGEHAFKQAVQLDEKEAVAYVCMCNIHADADKQDNNKCR